MRTRGRGHGVGPSGATLPHDTEKRDSELYGGAAAPEFHSFSTVSVPRGPELRGGKLGRALRPGRARMTLDSG